MKLQDLYTEQGALLAADGIPLHFGDLKREYHAALTDVILLDRSHEARLEVVGRDRFELINRMSTNEVSNLSAGQGVPTIFTNPNARIIDRAYAYNWRDESLLLLAGPGRAEPLRRYLQSNVFFNDQVTINNLSAGTRVFALHGPKANDVVGALLPKMPQEEGFYGVQGDIEGVEVFAGRMKPFVGSHWVLIVPEDAASMIWQTALHVGQDYGIQPAGGLTYNTLRIRAGHPGTGRELSTDYIPLEVGMWDEVSFQKGCYTGQEIIARMESRDRLARTIVRLELETFIDAPAELLHEGRAVGKITSSVLSPDDEIFAIGIIKSPLAIDGTKLQIGDQGEAVVIERIGVQPSQTTQ